MGTERDSVISHNLETRFERGHGHLKGRLRNERIRRRNMYVCKSKRNKRIGLVIQ